MNKATKSTKSKPKLQREDAHIEVDIEDLEGIYDKADYIKRKSQASLGAAAAMAAAETIDEAEKASGKRSDVDNDSKKDDGTSSESSFNVSRRSSVRSEAEYVVNDVTKEETDCRSGKGSERSEAQTGLSDSDKEQLSRQSLRSEHGSDNNAFCDDK